MSKKPLILGIESSCDETAASLITENEQGIPIVLSNIISSQVEVHKEFGGVVPELAARSHMEKIDWIVEKAINDSGRKIEEIDAVASTAGPGLIVCLSVGLSFGKAKDKIIQNTNIKDEDIIIKEITTKGDQVQDMRLSEVGGKGLFSTNIEKELQDKKIDIAVHALKDMPAIETVGLRTNTFLKRNDPREILITQSGKKLNELKINSIIGTSSYRREFQIKKIRSDLNCKLIRGNVDTRIKKLNDGLYDAIILSYAGIKSLEIEDKITEIFSIEEIIPSAGQGIIALQCRNNDIEIISVLDAINDKETSSMAHAERNVLKVLEGDCETAIGTHAIIEGDQITLQAELFSIDGKQRFFEKKSSKINDARELGKELGEILKTKSNNSYKR